MSGLRDYQLAVIPKVRAEYKNGARNVLLVSPTGSGKTRTATAMTALSYNHGTRVLFCAHKVEILEQTIEQFAQAGLRAGLIQAGHNSDPSASIQVASIATLARWALSDLPLADFLIMDEAKHCVATSYRRLMEHYRRSLGLEATPWLIGGKGLKGIFDASVVAATPSQLAERGYLVKPKVFAYARPDLKGLKLERGDYSHKGLQLACERQELMGSIVREYQLHGNGEPALVFAVSVAHSKQLVEGFRAAGFSAEHLDGDSSPAERKAVIDRFREGKLQVLSSCSIFSEGFDAPIASVAILARPTMSLALYLQQVGRVLRPHPGKKRALVHDHAGNCLRHGLPMDERDYSLEANERAKPEDTHHACPVCHAVVPKTSTECEHCGSRIRIVTTPRERRALRVQEQVERMDMDEVRAANDRHAHMSDRDLAVLFNASREAKGSHYLWFLELCRRKHIGGQNPERYAAQMYEQSTGLRADFTFSELQRLKPARAPLVTPFPKRQRTALG